MLLFVCVFAYASLVVGQSIPQQNGGVPSSLLRDTFSEGIGNFSLELLYHVTDAQTQNLIVSPINVCTVLAVAAEGATNTTRKEIVDALRLTRNSPLTRVKFQDTAKWFVINTTTVQLARFNALFVDKSIDLERELQNISKQLYQTDIASVDFKNSAATANSINQEISQLTRGRIPKLVESDSFGDTKMIIASSALFFKGQWTAPFNTNSTTKRDFYNTDGTKIGEVNMMYNRFTYPFAVIKDIKARVIELPYGTEDRLSMLLMLPNVGVTLQDMFESFKTVSLDTVFAELRLSQEEYGDDPVDCFIPRFKISSDIDLIETLKKGMGIYEMFNPKLAKFGHLAREPLYVSKVTHKVELEVTEEGTTAFPDPVAQFGRDIQAVMFEANRPFGYLIIEKVTNIILLEGVYQQPILY